MGSVKKVLGSRWAHLGLSRAQECPGSVAGRCLQAGAACKKQVSKDHTTHTSKKEFCTPPHPSPVLVTTDVLGGCFRHVYFFSCPGWGVGGRRQGGGLLVLGIKVGQVVQGGRGVFVIHHFFGGGEAFLLTVAKLFYSQLEFIYLQLSFFAYCA